MKAIYVKGGHIRHFADSSQQRNGQAWFLPETDAKWSAIVCAAIKITRLGTHIAEKFAGRYYERLSAVSIFLPADLSGDASTAAERYFLRDSAYCIGEGGAAGGPESRHEISSSGQNITFNFGSTGVDRIISDVSEFTTLKMGDIIILGDVALPPVALCEGDRSEVFIDGEKVIDLRIK